MDGSRAAHELTRIRWFGLIAIGMVVLTVSIAVAVHLGPVPTDHPRTVATILWHIRLPRALVAILVGWALGLAGALYQGMLRNPLAEPYLLGISGGAALGVTLALMYAWTLPWIRIYWPTVGAFTGALGATAVIYRLAQVRGHLPVHALILAGVVVNAIAGAIVLGLTVLQEYFRVQQVALWLMGHIQPVHYPMITGAALWTVVWTAGTWWDAPRLNLLILGEDTVHVMGLNPDRLRRRWLVFGAALTAMSVALAGMVGFVGLIVPHAMRLWVGSDFRRLLVASAFGGALLVLWADTCARILWYPREVPVGILTATLAGPYFLWQLRRTLVRE